MLDHEDLKWIATTSTELNSMLQQVSRYADLARQHKGDYNYLEMLGERVELASKTTQALFDRVTSAILAAKVAPAARKHAHPPFSVVPLPVEAEPQPTSAHVSPIAKATVAPRPVKAVLPPEFKIRNSAGSRELILLVDDEAEIADLAAEMLADEGYKVILARDGFEALKIYQQKIGRASCRERV